MNRIGDYALIGDCHSAALVGRDARIEWACFPRFDSPAWIRDATLTLISLLTLGSVEEADNFKFWLERTGAVPALGLLPTKHLVRAPHRGA
jgi:GH15 family glucan-1,4-alpha-glucosidase